LAGRRNLVLLTPVYSGANADHSRFVDRSLLKAGRQMTHLNTYKLSASPIYLLATFLASGWGCVAEAQTASAQTKPIQRNAEGDVTVLDRIVVTARKTNEDLKDVPESITVVPPESLMAAPFDPGAAIARNSPNVQWINRATGQQFFSIRGVSSLGTPVNFSDGTVAFC
jgi:iron complex outermembrane receptor protein